MGTQQINSRDSLLQHVSDLGVADNQYVGNMFRGGQLGVGAKVTQLDAATPLVFNPAVAVVTHMPTMWDNDPHMKHMVKALIETHAKQITGIDWSLTLNTQGTPLGHDTQELKVPTNSARSQPDPTFVWQEVTGNLIFNIHRKWICDIQHPDTNASLVTAVRNGYISPFVMSSFSMSMMVIQYDPTMHWQNVIDAFWYTAMFPTTTGEFGIERTINTTKPMERSIQYTCVLQQNEMTKYQGMKIAQILNLHKANYQYAPTTDGVNSDLLNDGINSFQSRDLPNFNAPSWPTNGAASF